MLEMCAGCLPWENIYSRGLQGKEKEEAKRKVLEEKQKLVAASVHSFPKGSGRLQAAAKFLERVPEQFVEFVRELKLLRYETKPNYAQLRALLREVGTGEERKAAAERELRDP